MKPLLLDVFVFGNLTCYKKIKNQKGFTLIEILVVVAITTILFSLTLTPLTQMKTQEVKTNAYRDVETAHQVAVQKANNPEQIKRFLTNTPTNVASPNWIGTAIDRCFGGRGAGCNAFIRNNEIMPAETINHRVVGGAKHSVTSNTTITVNCTATTCTEVILVVSTQIAAGTDLTRAFQQRIVIPAAVLSSRQEIDFSNCAGQIITGIDYATLTARCVPPSGQSTCSTQAGLTGPLLVLGQPANPANCQQPANTTCPSGMSAVGLMNGQPQCVPNPVCNDPFSTNCTPPACTPNWSPSEATICKDDTFTQTDLNNCPPGPNTQFSVGTNPLACAPSCTYSGAVKWPNTTTGPCGNGAVSISNNPPASNTIINSTLGYTGSSSVPCVDNSPIPAPDAFDFSAATNTCLPVTCNVPTGEVQWSAAGIRSATAGPNQDPVGPWPCKATLVVTQTQNPGPGLLITTQADANAKAVGTHLADVNASAGSITLTCGDAGPATDNARIGQLTVTNVSCSPPAPPVACGFGPINTEDLGGGGPLQDYNITNYACVLTNSSTKSGKCVNPNGAEGQTNTGDGCVGLNDCMTSAVSGSGVTIRNQTQNMTKINLGCAGDPPPPALCWTHPGFMAPTFQSADWDCTMYASEGGSCATSGATKNLGKCFYKPTGTMEYYGGGISTNKLYCLDYDALECWAPAPAPPTTTACSFVHYEECDVSGVCGNATSSATLTSVDNILKAIGYPTGNGIFPLQTGQINSFIASTSTAGQNTGSSSLTDLVNYGTFQFSNKVLLQGLNAPAPGKYGYTVSGSFSGVHPVGGNNFCSPCTDSTWLPAKNAADICQGQSIIQTSNCGNNQVINGTKAPDWRLLPGMTAMDPNTWTPAFVGDTATFRDINNCEPDLVKNGPPSDCWFPFTTQNSVKPPITCASMTFDIVDLVGDGVAFGFVDEASCQGAVSSALGVQNYTSCNSQICERRASAGGCTGGSVYIDGTPPPQLCWSRNPSWDANFVTPGICSLNGSCPTQGNSTTTKCLDINGNMTNTQVACYQQSMNECVYAPSDECNVPFPTQAACEGVFTSCVLSGSSWKKDCTAPACPPPTQLWSCTGGLLYPNPMSCEAQDRQFEALYGFRCGLSNLTLAAGESGTECCDPTVQNVCNAGETQLSCSPTVFWPNPDTCPGMGGHPINPPTDKSVYSSCYFPDGPPAGPAGTKGDYCCTPPTPAASCIVPNSEGFSWQTNLANNALIDPSVTLNDARTVQSCFYQPPGNSYSHGTTLTFTSMVDPNLSTGGGAVKCDNGQWKVDGTLTCSAAPAVGWQLIQADSAPEALCGGWPGWHEKVNYDYVSPSGQKTGFCERLGGVVQSESGDGCTAYGAGISPAMFMFPCNVGDTSSFSGCIHDIMNDYVWRCQ